MSRRTVALAVAFALAAAACAGADRPREGRPRQEARTTVAPSPHAPEAEAWHRIDLGPARGLLEVGLGAGPAGIVVGAVGEGKAPRMWFSRDGERWHRFALPGAEAGHHHAGVTSVGGEREGLVHIAAGGSEDALLPGVWHSSDAREWTRVLDEDFSGAGFVYQVRWTDLGFVAVGDVRPGGEAGPIQPGVWVSPDGREWERVVHETAEGSALTVVEFNGETIALGALDGRPVAWGSEDGRRWDRRYLPGRGGVHAAAPLPDRVVVLGTSARGFTAWTSADGVHWEVAAGGRAFGAEGEAHGEGEPAEAVPFADGVLATARLQLRTDPRWCYVEVTTCMLPTTELLFSRDGASWEVLAPPEGLTRPYPEPAIASFEGRLVVAGLAGRRLGVWLAEGLPASTPLEPETAPELPFEIVEWGATLEPGVEYGYPLYTHCGIEVLGEFNGKVWLLESEPADAPDWRSWVAQYDQHLYGTLRLVRPDRIEYSVPDGVVAFYAPTGSNRFLGGCD